MNQSERMREITREQVIKRLRDHGILEEGNTVFEVRRGAHSWNIVEIMTTMLLQQKQAACVGVLRSAYKELMDIGGVATAKSIRQAWEKMEDEQP